MLTFINLNIFASQKSVVLKPFDVSGNNPQDTGKYYEYMKEKLSKEFIVLEQPIKKKHYPEIEISFQYINQFIFFNVFYSNGYVKWNLISRIYTSKKDFSPIIDNLVDFFTLLLNSSKNSVAEDGNININIQTEPKHAIVFVNGFYYGSSPVTISKLNKNTEYSFLVYKFSYKPEITNIKITKKYTGATINFKLKQVFDDRADIIFNKIKKFIQPPKLIYKTFPEYPETARVSMNYQGDIVLIVGINDKGKVITVQVKDPDMESLYEAAIAAAKKCSFSPAIYKGIPLKYVDVQITYKFRLINNY